MQNQHSINHLDQLAKKKTATRQMVQHQHIAYAQNYNCGARYLQLYIIVDCNYVTESFICLVTFNNYVVEK